MNKIRNWGVATLAALAASGAMAQATMPAGVGTGIADAIAVILLVVAAGGLGMITVSSGSVAWTVGAKFIKRLAGKS